MLIFVCWIVNINLDFIVYSWKSITYKISISIHFKAWFGGSSADYFFCQKFYMKSKWGYANWLVGLHFQLPGGHVDKPEIKKHGLEHAFKVAAARELSEETGIDLRNKLERFVLADLGCYYYCCCCTLTNVDLCLDDKTDTHTPYRTLTVMILASIVPRNAQKMLRAAVY